jgi:molybdopterin-containing oxidoreductase family membrane subunit
MIQSLAGFDLGLLAFVFRLSAFFLAGLVALSLVPKLQSQPITSFVIASGLIVVQAWVKRFLIIVPVLEHPFLTAGNTALTGALYRPTWVELAITAGAMAGFLLVYFLLSRMFPIVSVWETLQDEKVEEPVGGSSHAMKQPATTSSPER